MPVDSENLKAELERMKYDDGIEYTKAKRLDLDESSKEIGAALSDAADRDWVEKWGSSGSEATWRILL